MRWTTRPVLASDRLDDVLAVWALVAVGGLVIALAPDEASVLKAMLVLPLLLVVPGYALTAAVLPARLLRPFERSMLSIGLSVAWLVVAGLLMHALRIPIERGTWYLAVVVLLLPATVAIVAHRRADPASAPRVPHPAIVPSQVAIVALAVVVALSAVVLARSGALAHDGPGFTQLWLLRADGPDAPGVRIGVRNETGEATRYRLEVRTRERVLRRWPSIAVANGATWEVQALLEPGERPEGPIEARLYRAGSNEVYRRVRLASL